MSHRTGRYPDWMLKAMLKAGVRHSKIKGRPRSETDLPYARLRIAEAMRKAECNSARAKVAGMIIAAKGQQP